MMLILSKIFGQERIFGNKFPQERALKKKFERGENETEQEFEYRKFLQGLGTRLDRSNALAKSVDMNPMGFWECVFTTEGLRYRVKLEKEYNRLKEMPDKSFIKLVSQGLSRSDPDWIDGVIYMLREPRVVAKSQEKLTRELNIRTVDGKGGNLFEGRVIHSPEMFIDVSIAAMRWLKRHPDIPVLLVKYDDLLDNPEQEIRRVLEFLSESDLGWERGASVIDPNLRRSEADPKAKSNFWNDAEDVYEALKSLDFEAIEEIARNPRRPINREARGWTCARTGLDTMEGHCLACKAGTEMLDQFIAHAEKLGAPWKEMPCAFDVAYNLDAALISIEESVKNNHWLERYEQWIKNQSEADMT
jgi:hypothetical protein